MSTTTPMNLLRNHAWRLALILSGGVMMIAGPMHPEAEATDSLREELATMTGHDNWVPGHTLIVLSATLLALGLWAAYRSRTWPTSTRRALKIAVVTASLYVVETVFHLASAVDHDALHAGEAAPVAFTHVGLAIVLYPVSGLAIAFLAFSLWRAWSLPKKLLALPGIVGGLAHALSVPLSLAFPDTEFTPVFAGSAMLIAVWSILTGLAVMLRTTAPTVRVPVPADAVGR
jgi:hypothetical protein